jgi:hypothetical protein
MKEALAKRLLAEVLGWSPEEMSEELPALQAMAAYKYDDYQQFVPGMRFVESLALWLSQLEPVDRRLAYGLVKERLVFCSASEMNHLTSMAFPDLIRPHLLRRVAAEAGHDERHVSKVAGSTLYLARLRQCLFLGLSDGARIDVFRRSNPELSHEQISQTYELAEKRIGKLLEKLRADLAGISAPGLDHATARFRTVVLLDDFSASGTSYFRKDGDARDGKIPGFLDLVTTPGRPETELIDLGEIELLVVLAIATDQARVHLEQVARESWGDRSIPCTVLVVHPLPSTIRFRRGDNDPFTRLIEHGAYYDPVIHDRHMRMGGTEDSRYGYADCGLPVIPGHNTPNNSLSLLWSYEHTSFRGLFPRIRRHKETR